MNRIVINSPEIAGKRISYHYQIEGDWQEAFSDMPFFIEYSVDVGDVPESIAVVPLICNLLPIAWWYDAEIVVSALDKAFYESIPEFKRGYQEMHPARNFLGKLTVENIEENAPLSKGLSAAFFSGGVDAFDTLIRHIDEKPALLSLWGADVRHEDVSGWATVEKHLEQTKNMFGVTGIVIKSALRMFINQKVLNALVWETTNHSWWYVFQHSIGMHGHAAPLAYLYGYTNIYFASTFNIKDKGRVICASDPSIDDHVKFGASHIVHDGYECSRQDKVNNIITYGNETGIKIPLRVCWMSDGGSNCCTCEKCWRTIIEIAALGAEPFEYGFEYTSGQAKNAHKIYWDKHLIPDFRKESYYRPTQQTMRRTYPKVKQCPKEFRWFWRADISKLGTKPLHRRVLSLGKRVVKKILHKEK